MPKTSDVESPSHLPTASGGRASTNKETLLFLKREIDELFTVNGMRMNKARRNHP